MKQLRYQPLAPIYQQLSTLLCHTALHIQSTDYTKAAAWARLIREVKKTFSIFEMHAEKEEKPLFPLLHRYEPALVALLRDDQYKRMRYLKEMSGLFEHMPAASRQA